MRDWSEIDAELINKFAKYYKYVCNNFTTKHIK